MTDGKNHDFFVKNEQTVMPVKCHAIVDTTTDESFGSASQIISSADDVTELCVEFEAKKFSESCGSESVSNNVDVKSYPNLG